MSYTLADDGDSFEARHAHRVLAHLPEMEALWQRHVVPLTYRMVDDDAIRNHYLRPELPKELTRLADSHYAAFYHLAQCWVWFDRIADPPGDLSDAQDLDLTPTECLYCFFAHFASAHDSIINFLEAVNEVLIHFGRDAITTISSLHTGTQRKAARRLESIAGIHNLNQVNRIANKGKRWRNILVHERIVYLQNLCIPRENAIDQYGGLAGLGRAALKLEYAHTETDLRSSFVRVDNLLEDLLVQYSEALGEPWTIVARALDGLQDSSEEYGTAQTSMTPAERRLTPDKIKAVRSWDIDDQSR